MLGVPQIELGEHFLLHMRVDDPRVANPPDFTQVGIASAYADISYDVGLVDPVTGSATSPAWYSQFNTFTDTSTAGEIDDFGYRHRRVLMDAGLETLVPGTIPSIPIEMISLELVATFTGLVNFNSFHSGTFEGFANPILDIALQQTSTPGGDPQVPFADVLFGSVQLNIIIDGVGAITDDRVATEDQVSNYPISNGVNGLIDNDLVEAGGTIVFDGVGPTGVTGPILTAAGGTVEVVAGNVVYTPLANYFGPDSFEYRIHLQGSAPEEFDVGTVEIVVGEVNDDPTANPDTANTPQDTMVSIPFADLLADDDPGPLEGSQTLTIISVQSPLPAGSTVAINGTNVEFICGAGLRRPRKLHLHD